MSATLTESQPVTVPVKDVERELTRQMKALQGPGENPVLRVRMANLLIFCNDADQAERINADIPDVVLVHPARVLLLIGESGADRELTATTSVRPLRWDTHHHAFIEQITLHAGGNAIHDLSFAVRALLIGDLPTNLWWAAPVPPPFAGPMLYELSEQAQQIVYDSLGWPEPVRGVAATASWLDQIERPGPGGRWRVASDLNWRRLKYWRRLLGQALTPGSTPGSPEAVNEVLVEHGPHAVVEAWELASWLTRRLGWRVQGGRVDPGVELTWRFFGPLGSTRVRIHRLEDGPSEVRHVRLDCTIKDRPATVHLAVKDGQRLAISLEGVAGEPRTQSLPPLYPAELIGRQLSDRERDPVFRESMSVAQVMAQSVLE